jgi:glycine/D-amino acid oxidase-like deaminating enzyme
LGHSHTIAIIGGGFYGCSVADYLARQGANVVIIERSPDLLTRASYTNQARLHNGYHYPRSFSTGYRSRFNFARFLNDFRPAIATNFVKLYAIARTNSKVSPRQFEFFCHNIEAPIKPAREKLLKLFSSRLVAAVYETQEYAFDAAVLRQMLRERLVQSGVAVHLNTTITTIQSKGKAAPLVAIDENGNGIEVDYIFNCTYSGLNQIQGISQTRLTLKHEITELALIELPSELAGVSVTVMDGPFFSFMPFPDRRLNTFSHVRYTPHGTWLEEPSDRPNPYATLETLDKRSNFGYMIRDAQRFIPCLQGAIHRDSLFEVKTVLLKNEGDDGRPILFEVNTQDPRIISILGSKIDNIYDAFPLIDQSLYAVSRF